MRWACGADVQEAVDEKDLRNLNLQETVQVLMWLGLKGNMRQEVARFLFMKFSVLKNFCFGQVETQSDKN